MFLTAIQLKNFRIHKDSTVKFSDNINFIVGGNGQGKTSIIEAIYYLCTTKNYKSASDSEIVNFNGSEFEVGGTFKDLTEDNIRIYFSLNENKKHYILNGKHVSRSAEVIGKFPVVLLTPDDHSLTCGYPSDRRKFVDSVISQASNVYLNTLLDYNKTLLQRTSLLNQLNERRDYSLLDELDAWNMKLVLNGTELIKYRKKFVAEFNNYVADSYQMIMDNVEVPLVEYQYLSGSNDNIEESFNRLLQERKEEEIRRGINLVGPHRDDFVFKINGASLKTYGSQGQHKTFQVALRFAQFFYIKNMLGRLPVFLLDDVFGELDTKRAVKISEYLKHVGQAFITITDFSNFSFLKRSENDLMIKVNAGNVAYV